MTWMDTAAELRAARVPAVLITLASVRGHAPREAGAKMIVAADEIYGTIGGGNLEMTAVTRAREMLRGEHRDPSAEVAPGASASAGSPAGTDQSLAEADHSPSEDGPAAVGTEPDAAGTEVGAGSDASASAMGADGTASDEDGAGADDAAATSAMGILESDTAGSDSARSGSTGSGSGLGRTPEMLTLRLNDKAPAKYGRQCCGGEVMVLLEPLPVPASVAVFGIGNIGLELARILSRHDIDLFLSDSRPEHLSELDRLETPIARVHRKFAVVGEEIIEELPPGTHVLIMTHDHAEDLHLCDAALARTDLGSVGLIGSRAKWLRFRKKLVEGGRTQAVVDTIQCPIGLPTLPGKHPATIAVSVAADLLGRLR